MGRKYHRWHFFLLLTMAILLSGLLVAHTFKQAALKNIPGNNTPRVLDNRLVLTLFAENPTVVTPIGIAVDKNDRIFVLESHTHLPPKDYNGPDGDIIKILEDKDLDGKPEKVSVFAQGLKEGLNLAFSPEGHLYAVTSRAVWVLYDKNHDGISEEQVKVAELVKPDHVYAHAALLGITFSPDGWMYISRGNTGGASWKLVGKDGSAVSGYGDGGNIVRARPDGSQLEQVATGFWNPVDLKMDSKGRLLAVDNDPDSRGPNRLVHIVPGGNYGYKSLYGGSGIHPYLAWNGELPGTLPYAVGLGEAPSGLLNADLAALPPDYQNQMLASIWEESTIVRINLASKGVSVTGTSEVIVAGNQQFRPVAFATDSKGTIYFTDWVLRDYPNHGKGRIWKLASKQNVATIKPLKEFAQPLANPKITPLEAVYATNSLTEFAKLKENLKSKDSFLRHAATYVLTQPIFREQVIQATRDGNPEVRLGAMLALQQSHFKAAEPILRELLSDKDERIRRQALQWIGEAGLTALQADIEKALSAGSTSPALFDTYLETVKHLMPDFIHSYRTQSASYAKEIKRVLPLNFISSFITDKSKPAALRALAIRHLENPEKQIPLLTSLVSADQEEHVQLEAIRSLAQLPDLAAGNKLVLVAANRGNSKLIRAEALLALTRQPTDATAKVIPLLQDPDKDVQVEAAGYLRTKIERAEVKQALRQKYAMLPEKGEQPMREQLALALTSMDNGKSLRNRPVLLPEWETALATGGNALRGRRVFFSGQAICSSCHAVQGRGGDLGPDLTNVGHSKSRSQLISSIIRPSKEISPEYQGWYIKLKNGEYYQGRQIDIGGNSMELYTHAAGNLEFAKKDVLDYGRVEKSLMPEGLEAQLTTTDLRDLLAFLEAKAPASLQGKISDKANKEYNK